MDLEQIKRKILVKYPFFGSVLAKSNFIEEPLISTAATDGTNIFYNPAFLANVNDEEKTFVLSHEICHIAFNHIFRSEGKNPRLWNIATDSVINAFLKQDGLPIIDGCIDNDDAINYDAEELYQKLLDEQKQQNNNQSCNCNNGSSKSGGTGNNQSNKENQQQSQSQQNESTQNQEQQQNQKKNGGGTQKNDWQQQSQKQSSSGGESSQKQDTLSQGQSEGETSENSKEENQNDVGHDTHSMWGEAVKKKKEEEASKSSKKDKDSREKIEDISDLGEREAFKQNKIERNKQLDELRKVLIKQSHSQSFSKGTRSKDENIDVENIGIAEPLIDWRRLLKETIKYDVDWTYSNAGIEDGVVTPYLEEIPLPETEILLDTSGSIESILLKNFLRECKNIMKVSKVKVGCFDVKFYGFHEIRTEKDIDNMTFYGGGGTNFDVAINSFSRRVENKIIFTDGRALMPNTPLDVIWIVFGNQIIYPMGGKVIYIDENALRKKDSGMRLVKKK